MKQPAVLVTGASSGIGKAISIEFAKSGKSIILSSRKKNPLERLKKELKTDKNDVEIFPIDVADIENIQETYSQITNDYSIECLVNNAGVTSFASAEENSLDEVKEIIGTNLLGAIYMIKTVLHGMIENKKGTIINILSVAAKKIFANSSAYSASKAGLEAYSKVLREEVREHNIRVINILPGATKTPIWPNESLEKFSDRMMSPDEIAKLVYQAYSINSNLVTEEIVIRPIKGDL